MLASAQAKIVDVFILEETAECTVDIQEKPTAGVHPYMRMYAQYEKALYPDKVN